MNNSSVRMRRRHQPRAGTCACLWRRCGCGTSWPPLRLDSTTTHWAWCCPHCPAPSRVSPAVCCDSIVLPCGVLKFSTAARVIDIPDIMNELLRVHAHELFVDGGVERVHSLTARTVQRRPPSGQCAADAGRKAGLDRLRPGLLSLLKCGAMVLRSDFDGSGQIYGLLNIYLYIDM